MAKPIKIGSFNMYEFNYQSNDKIKKDIDKIAEAIAEAKFDILAVQEINNKWAADSLKARLPRLECSWKPSGDEGYAYLWNKYKFRLAPEKVRRYGSAGVPVATESNPGVFAQYKSLPGRHRLVRDPLCIRLESIYGRYEIRLINTHIIHRQDLGIERRREEFKTLVDIYCRFEDQQYGTRPAYTFLLGDYNLNLKGRGKYPLTGRPALRSAEGSEDNERIERQDHGRAKRIVTIQDQLTTLKDHSHEEPKKPAQGFANNFDHFTYDEIYFSDKGGVVLKSGAINTVDGIYGEEKEDRFDLHRKEISDHIPIYLYFGLC